MQENNKLVGGVFGLELNDNPSNFKPPFLYGDNLYLANTRSGIKLLIDNLKLKRCWLPSYLCKSIFLAVECCDIQVSYYPVDQNLSVSDLSFIDEIKSTDMFLYIDYFGFPFDKDIIKNINKKGAYVIKDASQALFSDHKNACADYILYSPRKFLGIPDGGILSISKATSFGSICLMEPPDEWWLKSLESNIKRREHDLYGGNRNWFKLFQQAEEIAPIGNFKMSELSLKILRNKVDYNKIRETRISNYRTLLNDLEHLAIFPHLEDGIVPLGFPIRVNTRDQCRMRLFEHTIFPPIHWDIKDFVPKSFDASHMLADQIMTIPCDQRYNKDDMLYISQQLKNESAQ